MLTCAVTLEKQGKGVHPKPWLRSVGAHEPQEGRFWEERVILHEDPGKASTDSLLALNL